MHKRFAAPVASAATAILLLGACGDDGPTTLAKGEDIELVGNGTTLEGQTLNISAEEQDGEVTGELRVTDNVIDLQCADTDTDGFIILGGEATAGPDVADGDLIALVIREGQPDSVALYSNDAGATSCSELLDSMGDVSTWDDADFVDLEAGSDIET